MNHSGAGGESFRVVAVDLLTGERRTLTTGKTKENAEAYADMAVIRRGVDREIFVTEQE